jgi:hypothetical protein
VAATGGTARPRPDGRRQRAGFREIVDGFRYLSLHKVLLVSFLIDIVAMGFGMPRVVFPEMASGRSATRPAAGSHWACSSRRSRSGWSPRGSSPAGCTG